MRLSKLDCVHKLADGAATLPSAEYPSGDGCCQPPRELRRDGEQRADGGADEKPDQR